LFVLLSLVALVSSGLRVVLSLSLFVAAWLPVRLLVFAPLVPFLLAVVMLLSSLSSPVGSPLLVVRGVRLPWRSAAGCRWSSSRWVARFPAFLRSVVGGFLVGLGLLGWVVFAGFREGFRFLGRGSPRPPLFWLDQGSIRKLYRLGCTAAASPFLYLAATAVPAAAAFRPACGGRALSNQRLG